MKKVEKTIDVEAKEVQQIPNLKQKIAIARQIIAKTPMKKDGENKFSNFKYFTPSQVEALVEDACSKVGILCCYNLEPDPSGDYMASMVVHDLESDHALAYKMATARPEIKATNAAQQMGGVVTYSQRYLKMSIFGITDSNLDFDAQDNRPKAATKLPPPPVVKKASKVMTDEIKDTMLSFIKDGKGHLVSDKLGIYKTSENKTVVMAAMKA